jgi:hypothetical protein
VNWLVEANVSEKRTVSIFRTEVTLLGIRGIRRLPFLPPYILPLIPSERHFSPEDGDSMLLRSVGFYQPVHTPPKPRRISSLTEFGFFVISIGIRFRISRYFAIPPVLSVIIKRGLCT